MKGDSQALPWQGGRCVPLGSMGLCAAMLPRGLTTPRKFKFCCHGSSVLHAGDHLTCFTPGVVLHAEDEPCFLAQEMMRRCEALPRLFQKQGDHYRWACSCRTFPVWLLASKRGPAHSMFMNSAPRVEHTHLCRQTERGSAAQGGGGGEGLPGCISSTRHHAGTAGGHLHARAIQGSLSGAMPLCRSKRFCCLESEHMLCSRSRGLAMA